MPMQMAGHRQAGLATGAGAHLAKPGSPNEPLRLMGKRLPTP
jgi:hypothetical protein